MLQTSLLFGICIGYLHSSLKSATLTPFGAGIVDLGPGDFAR